MTTLREHLLRILPDFLSTDPAKAAYGTELARKIRPHLHGRYSEYSIRQCLSLLAADPNAPLVRVQRGHGYYMAARASSHIQEACHPSVAEMPEQISLERRYKSISRIDQPRKHTHGWYVRVIFRDQRVAKFFSDRICGGKEAALAEAIAFRNATERRLKKPRTDRPVFGRSRRPGTGIVGVRRVIKRSQGRDGQRRERAVYEVTWSPAPGLVRRTSVSISRYGERGALRRALMLRRTKEREMYRAQSHHSL